MEYLIVKWIHIVSSTFLFGTGIGSAFYLFFSTINRDPRVIAFVARYVVIADWLFTATTIVVQPISGFYLAYLMHFSVMTTSWLLWSTTLYIVAALCWLPVIWLQMRMRDIAGKAAQENVDLPSLYWRYFYIWVALGFAALFAFIAIFYLMVAKPA
jgi:uncharacterized membrane protein